MRGGAGKLLRLAGVERVRELSGLRAHCVVAGNASLMVGKVPVRCGSLGSGGRATLLGSALP